jgi:hypothetical protein
MNPNSNSLPPGYIAQWDQNYQRYYFVDTRTGISSWNDPRVILQNQNSQFSSVSNSGYPANNTNLMAPSSTAGMPQVTLQQGTYPPTPSSGAPNQFYNSNQNYPQQGYAQYGNAQQHNYPHPPNHAYPPNQGQNFGNGSGKLGGLDSLVASAGPLISSILAKKKYGKFNKF